MKERFVVYIKNTSNKLYEAGTVEAATSFVDHREAMKRRNGDFEPEKYEIVRIVR